MKKKKKKKNANVLLLNRYNVIFYVIYTLISSFDSVSDAAAQNRGEIPKSYSQRSNTSLRRQGLSMLRPVQCRRFVSNVCSADEKDRSRRPSSEVSGHITSVSPRSQEKAKVQIAT